jgi:hypothetical protein
MRWILMSTVLMLSLIVVTGASLTATAKSIRLPGDPVEAVAAGHPIIGDWVETTALGPVPVSFVEDGTLVMAFPDSTFGNLRSASIGAGHGTWEPAGVDGVVYEVVRTVVHESGRNLATISIKGYLILSPDGRTFTDDGRLTIIITRNSMGNISTISGVTEDMPVAVASRALIGQTGIARPPSGQVSPPETFQGGCNTCR